MLRAQRGKRITISEIDSMLLTAAMKRSVSLGISSRRQPSLVSNKIEEIPVGGKIQEKAEKDQKLPFVPSSAGITSVPLTLKAKLVELCRQI